MWVFEYFLEGIYKIVFNFKIKCGYWYILVFFLNKKKLNNFYVFKIIRFYYCRGILKW